MDREEFDLSILDTSVGYFDFLGEDGFPRLEAVPTGSGGARRSERVKRDHDGGGRHSDEYRETSPSGTSKTPRVDSASRVSRSKACREKARRERINER